MEASDQHPIMQLWEAARWRLRSLEDLKSMSWFTTANYTNIFMFLFFVAFAIYQARSKMQKMDKHIDSQRYLPAPDFPEIEGLNKFSWKGTKPLALRKFKAKYFLTMGLERLNPSELILMDQNYASRLEYRKKIMAEHPDIAVGVNDDERIAPAVRELYGFLFGTYLPKRFPTMFKLHKASFESGDTFMLESHITKEVFGARPSALTKTTTLLQTLGRTIDEDFLILLPEEKSEEGKDPKYVLEAYVTICPAGFNPREKLGKRLADIHQPVPSYDKILANSMDRYFTKLQAGEYMTRSNWNITTHSDLFAIPGKGSNHAKEGDVLEPVKDIDPENTFLRCERQTLHRLPKTKAIVFAFKTYMYPLKDIKEEGLGGELAAAVDGMKTGNAPGVHFYKRAPVWGEAVKRYLRS